MIRVAAVQASPDVDIENRKAQLHTILSKMDEKDVDFVCFPEGFLTGYYADESSGRIHSMEVVERQLGLPVSDNYLCR